MEHSGLDLLTLSSSHFEPSRKWLFSPSQAALHFAQDLANSLDDLLLFCRGELSQAQRLVLHFDLARAAQVEFIVHLDRDRGQ